MNLELKSKNDISGTCWIEFNRSGTVDKFTNWDNDSKYLDEFAYNLFTDLFENNTDDFNYYGPSYFTSGQLTKIKRDFEKRINDYINLTSLTDLIEFSKKASNSLNLDHDLQEAYEQRNRQINKLTEDIHSLGKSLIAFFDKCILEQKSLWILGL